MSDGNEFKRSDATTGNVHRPMVVSRNVCACPMDAFSDWLAIDFQLKIHIIVVLSVLECSCTVKTVAQVTNGAHQSCYIAISAEGKSEFKSLLIEVIYCCIYIHI